MNSGFDSDLRRFSRALAEIAHVLESSDEADARVRRALVLTGEIVPYARCVLLKAIPGTPPELVAEPAVIPEQRGRVLQTMLRLFTLVASAEETDRPEGADGPHLALPLMGLDQVIGVLRVEPPPGVSYDARHLRLLSVVAAQVGAYLSMIRLRDEEARRTSELATAHDFQQLLVGVASHDLRSPLSVITMVANHLLKTAQDEQQIRRSSAP